MATTLAYTVSDFTPFTKIVSADVNSRFSDIKSRINWAGTTSATTGLGDDNIQSITASGGGLTRATKLKAGTANYILINDSNGAMSQEQYLALSRGGMNMSITPTTGDAAKVLAVNTAETGYELVPVPASPVLKMIPYFLFS